MGINLLATKIVGHKNSQPSVTEEELKYIIEEIEDEGVLEEQESDLVKSALEFDEITVSEILVPRVNIIGIELNTPIEEVRRIFIETGFSRLPVYDKTIDTIIGILHKSDFYELYLNKDRDIKALLKKTGIYFRK